MLGRRWIKETPRVWQNGASNVFRSTVDNQNLTRDEARRVTEKEDCCVGNIPGISHATSWNRPILLSITTLGHEPIYALRPRNRTRCDDIRTDAMRSFFHRKDGRCRVYRSFRGGDMYLIRCA
jgi:hypothetical protein